jgi:hypothetical protein
VILPLLLWGGGRDRLAVFLKLWRSGRNRLTAYLMMWRRERNRLAVYLMLWRRGINRLAVHLVACGGGGGGMLRKMMASQSLLSLTWFELPSHKITQLAEERYSGSLLLLLLRQVGGYDGD